MKKIINGALYDTKTAKRLYLNKDGEKEVSLYRKKPDKYFIYYRIKEFEIENIKIMSYDEAMNWGRDSMNNSDFVRNLKKILKR